MHISWHDISARRIHHIARELCVTTSFSSIDGMDVVFQAKLDTVENASDAVDALGLARLEDLSEKMKVSFFSTSLPIESNY